MFIVYIVYYEKGYGVCVLGVAAVDGDVSGRGASGGRGARRSVVGSAPARVRGGGVSRRSVVGGVGARPECARHGCADAVHR